MLQLPKLNQNFFREDCQNINDQWQINYSYHQGQSACFQRPNAMWVPILHFSRYIYQKMLRFVFHQQANQKLNYNSLLIMINKNQNPSVELTQSSKVVPSDTIVNKTQSQQTQWSTQISSKVQQNIKYLRDKYDDYKRKKQQKLLTFPEPKVYPSKPHLMQLENLRKFNFSKLSKEQIQMLDDLSTFTPHREFVKMLTNRYSDMKKKEHFIKEHSSILTSDQFGDFNRAKFQYENNSRTFAAFCTSSLTLAGFLVGLYVLPARKSPWKYSFIGLGVGIGLSYGFWRMQIFQYHNKMNDQFKSIMRDKYENQKKTQRLRSNKAA